VRWETSNTRPSPAIDSGNLASNPVELNAKAPGSDRMRWYGFNIGFPLLAPDRRGCLRAGSGP